MDNCKLIKTAENTKQKNIIRCCKDTTNQCQIYEFNKHETKQKRSFHIDYRFKSLTRKFLFGTQIDWR